MPERTETRRQRADGREKRRSQNAQPREDQTTGSSESQAFATARKAAGTAAAAALTGALAGGLKAIVDRRQRSDARAAPSPPEATNDEPRDDRPEEPADESTQEEPRTTPAVDEEPAEPPQGASRSDVAKMMEQARTHLRDLLGEEPESVSGISSANGSWSVTLEVVEVHRIPETTDVLASYEVVLDDDGGLVRLERGHRYFRSQVEEGL
jgi:hypothetical protein